MRKEIICDECEVSEFIVPVDECNCEDPPRALCTDCHKKLHPITSALKRNWGEYPDTGESGETYDVENGSTNLRK